MATYDGKTDWRPYNLQFTHIVNRYKWSPEQRLDKLIECLRDKALKFYSVKTKTVQENYDQLCKKMVIDGHPDTPEAFVEIVTIDAFLKGCTDKKAALTAMDKNPNTIDEAMQYVEMCRYQPKGDFGNKENRH